MVWGAGRGFSILPAGFGCEVGMDAWVGGYAPGVGVTIHLTLPPQPFRAAWWQPAVWIFVYFKPQRARSTQSVSVQRQPTLSSEHLKELKLNKYSF